MVALVWDTLKNLFAAFVIVNKSSDFSETSFTAVWEGWGWASDWAAVFSKVGFTEADLTLVSWVGWILPWSGAWTDDNSVGLGPAAVVLDLFRDVPFFGLAVVDADNLFAFFSWMLPFSVDW